MTIVSVHDRQAWNTYIKSLSRYTFLHSWEWGAVQREQGEEVEYLGFYEGEKQIGAALLIGIHAKRGRHWLCPHGPLFAAREDFAAGLAVLKTYVRAQRLAAVALRVAPLLLNTPRTRATLQQAGFRPAPMHVHAELTWVLDITSPAEELLRGVRKTTRHVIKKAEAAGVVTQVLTDPTALERFWPLYEQTRQRQGFVPFSQEMLQAQLEIFGVAKQAFTIIASHQGVDVAAAILFHFGDTVYYYHGASRSNIAVPAPHLVQWQAILAAKNRGATTYNFWGIAPDNKPRHPFAGLTVFKKGFGGKSIDYVAAHDLPLSWKYAGLWAVDSWRKWRRGF